jgi:anti-sigma factor ChrR (cupin superfamily)
MASTAVACRHENRASLYALGLLDTAESQVFEKHLSSCSICEKVVRQSGDLAVELARTIPLSSPPEELRGRVLAPLSNEVRKNVPLPKGVAALVRGPELNWQPTQFPGVFLASLYTDSTHGELASLVRMEPGAIYPSHHHSQVEHCYVMQGDLVFEDHVLNSGDYEAAQPGTKHSPVTTKSGCLLFLVHNVNDTVYTR